MLVLCGLVVSLKEAFRLAMAMNSKSAKTTRKKKEGVGRKRKIPDGDRVATASSYGGTSGGSSMTAGSISTCRGNNSSTATGTETRVWSEQMSQRAHAVSTAFPTTTTTTTAGKRAEARSSKGGRDKTKKTRETDHRQTVFGQTKSMQGVHSFFVDDE